MKDSGTVSVSALVCEPLDGGRWWVLSAGGDSVRWWDVDAGPSAAVEGRLDEPQHNVQSAAFAPLSNGSRLVIGTTDRHELWRWDAASGEPIGPPVEPAGLRRRTSFLNPMVVVEGTDGPVVVSSLPEGSLCRHDARSGVEIGRTPTTHGRVFVLSTTVAADDTPIVVSGGQDAVLHRWDARTWQPWGPSIGKVGVPVAVSSTRLLDGRVVLSVASMRGRIHRIDLVTGEPIAKPILTDWEPNETVSTCVAVVTSDAIGDGGYIAGCVDFVTIRRWDMFSGEPFGEPIRVGSRIVALATAKRADGTSLLLAGDMDGRLWQFDAVTGRAITDAVTPHRRRSDRWRRAQNQRLQITKRVDEFSESEILDMDDLPLRDEVIRRLEELTYAAYLRCAAEFLATLRTLHDDISDEGRPVVDRTLELVRKAADGQEVRDLANRVRADWVELTGFDPDDDDSDPQPGESGVDPGLQYPCCLLADELAGRLEPHIAAEGFGYAAESYVHWEIAGENICLMLRFLERIDEVTQASR